MEDNTQGSKPSKSLINYLQRGVREARMEKKSSKQRELTISELMKKYAGYDK